MNGQPTRQYATPPVTSAAATALNRGVATLPRAAEPQLDQIQALVVSEEARRYGAALGDETAAAVHGFERQPPDPRVIPVRGRAAASAFATDPAMPPLTSVRSTPTNAHRPAAVKPRAGGKRTDSLGL